jgi:hypothetical protein
MTATQLPTDARTSGTDWYTKGGIVGIVFAVLLAVSFVMQLGSPDTKNAAKVQAWDIKHTGALGGAALFGILAVITGLFFFIWLRSQLDRPGSWVGQVYVAGAVVFAMSGVVGDGINLAISSDAKHLSQGSLQLLNSLAMNLNYPIACAGLALMFLGAGLLIRTSGALPGWLAWVSFVFAVLATSFFLGFIALLGSVLWVLVASVVLLMHPVPAER